jgi:hypothetical protein
MKFLTVFIWPAVVFLALVTGLVISNQGQGNDTYWRIITPQNGIWISHGKPAIDRKHHIADFTEAVQELPATVTWQSYNEIPHKDGVLYVAQVRQQQAAQAQPQPAAAPVPPPAQKPPDVGTPKKK